MGSRELNHRCRRYGISQSSTRTVLSIIFPVPLKVRRITYCWEATFAFRYCALTKNKPKFTKKCICFNNSNLYWSCEKDNRVSVLWPPYGKCMSNTDNTKQKIIKTTSTIFWYNDKEITHLWMSVWKSKNIGWKTSTGITKLQCLLRRGWRNIFCEHSFKFDMDLVNRAARH